MANGKEMWKEKTGKKRGNESKDAGIREDSEKSHERVKKNMEGKTARRKKKGEEM